MPLDEKIWWKRIFERKKQQLKVDVLKDLEAITDFLSDLNKDKKKLIELFAALEELEKELEIAGPGLRQINLDMQAKVIDEILERYGALKNDVDINAIRVKEIAEKFLRNAEKEGMPDLVKAKKKDPNWTFKW